MSAKPRRLRIRHVDDKAKAHATEVKRIKEQLSREVYNQAFAEGKQAALHDMGAVTAARISEGVPISNMDESEITAHIRHDFALEYRVRYRDFVLSANIHTAASYGDGRPGTNYHVNVCALVPVSRDFLVDVEDNTQIGLTITAMQRLVHSAIPYTHTHLFVEDMLDFFIQPYTLSNPVRAQENTTIYWNDLLGDVERGYVRQRVLAGLDSEHRGTFSHE